MTNPGFRVYAALGIIAILSFAIRVLPFIVSGMPYQTDTWPLLRAADDLVAKTPIPLSAESGFNIEIQWPGTRLFSAVALSVITLPAATLLPILFPLITALGVFPLYALVKRMGFSTRPSLFASLLFALSGAEAVISAGVTKEGYAIPLLLVSLLLLKMAHDSYKPLLSSLLFLVVIMVCGLTHHLTTSVAILMSTYLLVAAIFQRGKMRNRLTVGFLLLGTLALAYAASYSFFSQFLGSMGFSALILLLALSIAGPFPFLLSAAFNKPLTRLKRVWAVLLFFVSVTVLSAEFFTSLPSGLHPVPLYLIPAVLPYLAVALLAVLAIVKHADKFQKSSNIIAIWCFGLLGVLGFTALVPGMSVYVLRIADFLMLLIAVPAAYALHRLYSRKRLLPLVILVVVCAGSAATLPYVAFFSGEFGGSQRTYSQSDISACSWVGSFAGSSAVYGDIRYYYIINEYFQKPVAIYPAYEYFAEGKLEVHSGIFLYYTLMDEIGFQLDMYGFPLNPGSKSSASDPRLAICYSNGNAEGRYVLS